jgi:plasmid stabilization system protein ParE
MKFNVFVTTAAEADISQALDWYADQSDSAAARWAQHLADALESLEAFPERCSIAPDRAFLRRTVRQLVFGGRAGRYRLLFEVQGGNVYVLRLRHGARQLLQEPGED